jgi:hypothetical protein
LHTGKDELGVSRFIKRAARRRDPGHTAIPVARFSSSQKAR